MYITQSPKEHRAMQVSSGYKVVAPVERHSRLERRRGWAWLPVALAIGWIWLLASNCGADDVKEYGLKAVYLVKFADYVEWPATAFANADAPIFIGVLGVDPFGKSLDDAAKFAKPGKHARKFEIKRANKVDDLKSCHIIFVSGSEKNQFPQILASLGAANILTVGDTDGFADHDGIINLVIQDESVRWELNVGAAARHGIEPSTALKSHAIRLIR